MQRFVLSHPVTITGTNVFGLKSEVTLAPAGKPGWFWVVDGKDVLIDKSMLRLGRNNLYLEHGGTKGLHTYEHLGALRFTGLDGVRIITNNTWLPYDGSAGSFWQAVLPSLRPEGRLRPCQVAHEVQVRAKKEQERFVWVAPGPPERKGLLIQIEVDYPDIGIGLWEGHTPSIEFENILHCRALVLSRHKSVAKIASRLGVWPHVDHVLWKNGKNTPQFRQEIACHRAIDFLGALSTALPAGTMLVGAAGSYKGGHAIDLELLSKLDNPVRP